MVYAASFLAIGSMAAQMTYAQPAIVKAPAAQQSAAQVGASAPLDYEVFRTKVQPILTGPRRGNARCTSCHSRAGGNAFLDPLPPGATSYTEEQSRRNFERVSRLVVPGQPTRSILLTNPLLEEAGGSHWHGGGKHWQSQDNTEWQTLAAWVKTPPAAPAAPKPGLSFEVFRTKVQPILTGPRKGNARCTACHSRGGGNAFLDPLPPGATTYTEEQSRRNFERVSRLVSFGQPTRSILLTNPLLEEAGGSHWHGGGKHWPSQDNAEWQTLAAWVRGN